MSYEFQGYTIPDYMMEGIKSYTEKHRGVGDFLTAVFENNFCEALSRADGNNLRNIRAYAAYLYNEADQRCWGSKAKVKAWLKMKEGD
jgi:hypothetical protein